MSNMTILVKTPAGLAFGSLVAFLAEKRMEFSVTNDATNSAANVNNMTIVVKTAAGPDFTSLVAFLAEKLMEFAVTHDAPVANSEASNAPQASEDDPRMSGGRVKREEPEFDAPPNMEQVARNNKRISASRNVPKTFEDQSQVPTKRIKQEEPELETIIQNEELETPTVEIASASERAESRETNIPDVEEEMEDLEEQPVSDKQSSSSSKLIECRLCSRKIIKTNSFYQKAHAAAHLRLKTYKCTVCEMVFAESSNGKSHFKHSHPGIQFVPLVRTITEEEGQNILKMRDLCFPKDIRQRWHENDIEDETASEQESRKKIYCKICNRGLAGKTFTKRKNHALSHLELKTWKCTICQKSFARAEAGRGHFEVMHPDVPFVHLVNTRTDEDEEQLRELVEKCFPSAQK